MSDDTQTQALEKVLSGQIIDPMPVAGRRNMTPMSRMGVPGYAINNGYVMPFEEDARLTGRAFHRLVSDNLANVTIIATAVRYFSDLISSASISFAPGEESSAGDDVAEFFQDVFDDMETPHGRIMRRAAMYKFYGFSIQEWTAKKREDGRVGFADIEPRPQRTIERWDIDSMSGLVRGVIQRNPNNGQEIYIPREKMLYMSDDTISDSPEGLGLFRHSVRTAAGLRRFEDLEHWGFETDLQGIPIGRAPLSELEAAVNEGRITEAQAAAGKAVIQSFVENHVRGPKTGLMLDSRTYETTDERQAPSSQRLWDIELLKTGGTSHAQIDVAIKRKTFELARLFGIEHLLIGSEGGGSLALHKSSTQRLHAMVNSCLTEIVETEQRQIVRTLATVNNIPTKITPKMKAEKIAYRTIEEVVNALSGMATAGAPIMPDDPAVGEVRDIIGLSRPDYENSILAGLQQMGAGTVADDQIGDELANDRTGEDEPGGRGKPKARSGRASARQSSPADPKALLTDLAAYISANRASA